MSVAEQCKKLVEKVAGQSVAGLHIQLVEGGILDSVSIVSLVEELEKEFGCKIDNSEILPENFATIDAIAAFIGTKVQGSLAKSG